MCGIIGYAGNNPALPYLLDGLAKLEYRGYDSAGVAIVNDHQKSFTIVKAEGKLASLVEKIENNKSELTLTGTVGIGHTRWATHGKPSETNAHPHQSKNFCIIHNGIIENFNELREELIGKGYKFVSETDTEVIVHLISDIYTKLQDPFKAVHMARSRLKGAYAVGVIDTNKPDTLYAIREGAPLILGTKKGENFIASDIMAVCKYTNEIIFMDNGDLAVLTRDKIQLYDKEGKEKNLNIRKIDFDSELTEKRGYPHFMLKEIFEQATAIANTLNGRISRTEGKVLLDDFIDDEFIAKIKRIYIVACGTAYYSGLVSKFIFEQYLRVPTEVDLASEFRYRDPIIDKDTLFIAISQSGETADTLAAAVFAKKLGAKLVSVCNVYQSSLARESDAVVYTYAGPEIGVASTKAFTTQLVALDLIALYMAERLDRVTKDTLSTFVESLARIPAQIETVLEQKDNIEKIAKQFYKKRDFLYLGRGVNYPIALEGALKLKEISYIHAEGYPSGEMKHGPIALIDDGFPVIAIVPRDKNYDKSLNNIEEVVARGGTLIAIGSEHDKYIKAKASEFVPVPETISELTPILNIIPLQLLAYFVAVKKGTDVDKPRNLAKSVTVE